MDIFLGTIKPKLNKNQELIMKSFIKRISIIFILIFISGCGTANYVKPTHIDKKEKYNLTINKDFDQVWKQLIRYSASTFFAIDNFEKDSGLITLSFGASKPSDFITGGHWEMKFRNFDGEYVDYITKFFDYDLTGKMNIVVSKISDTSTSVIVNARYIYSAAGNMWVFDTGNCDTVTAKNPAFGIPPNRTICPTYKAENSIINALR
jgi:hypothetical protein